MAGKRGLWQHKIAAGFLAIWVGRRQARFVFRLHLVVQELTNIGGVFDLIGLHTHNHSPAAFLRQTDDLLGFLRRSQADRSRPLTSS